MLAKDLIKQLERHPEARVSITAPVAYLELEVAHIITLQMKIEDNGYVFSFTLTSIVE